jgi:Protein of unknown function (DUF3187)
MVLFCLEDAFLFDFELTRANLVLQYGVFDRLAVELEVPLLYIWKGFLDDFIKGFERATGFKREIRFERPPHLFSDVLQKDGRAVLRGTSGAVGIGDMAISTKALLRDESRWSPAIAARAALKLPTGDQDRALGSGEALKARGYVIYAGQGDLAAKIFRVANMGHLTSDQFRGFLVALREVLAT